MDALTHISCPNCGADNELVPGALSLDCPYCGSVISLVNPSEEPPLSIEFLVPVGVDKPSLAALAHTLMVQPETVPDDILEKSQVEEESFLYVPCFMGQGTFSYQWSATFGFDRQESYTDFVTKTDSKGRRYQEAVTRYRTVTDWRPASGAGSGNFQRLFCASDPASLDPKVATFLQSSVPFQPIVFDQSLMGGIQALDFAFGPDQAATAIEGLVRSVDATAAAHGRAQGQHQKDWSIEATANFNVPVKAGFIPLAKFVFSYGGKSYAIWSEGVALACYLADAFPVDPDRGRNKSQSYLPFWLTLLAGAACLALVYLGKARFVTPVPMCVAAGLTLVFAKLRSRSITKFSKALRQASLAAKRLELSDASSPLPDQERRQLLEASRPPSKPLLARTDHDFLLLGLLALVSKDILVFSLNVGDWFSDLTSRDSRPAREEGLRAHGEAGDGAGPTATPVPARTTVAQGAYDSADLSCSGRPPDRCRDGTGPVSGLVYGYRDGAGGQSGLGFIGQYENGRPHGPMVYFDPDMAISRVVNFSQGTVHGLTFDLHPRQPGSSYQKIAELAPIDGGKVSGTVLGFDLEGNLVSAVVYRDGRPNGPGTEYYSDGSVRSETEYVDGRQNGGKRSFRQGQMQKDQPGFTQVQLFEEILAEANRMVDAANEILANKNG